MDCKDTRYQAYIDILFEELRPAMGCTEPIAVAYACAKAKQVLGMTPEQVELKVSGNIIKNVKSVVVPNTGGKRGLGATVAAGVTVAEADKELECLATVPQERLGEIDQYLAKDCIAVDLSTSDHIFDIDVTVYGGGNSAQVRIVDSHTNIVLVRHNEEILLQRAVEQGKGGSDRDVLSVEGIIDFADTVDLSLVEEPLLRQIQLNSAIAQAGLDGAYGASIGRVILNTFGEDNIKTRAKARAAAGSDARMSGCELPVVIVSGSGNQGITASVPVIEYAQSYGVDQETLLRGLIISNLLTIHQKTGIGRLSAFCGAVSAAAGAAGGIAYLQGGRMEAIAHTVVNALAVISGMVCDGAKPSCAGKIAAALDAGLMGYEMYQHGHQFYSGDGLVKKGVENTINNIARLGRVGMHETDREILRMMMEV